MFDGLNPDRVMFSGNSLSCKKLYLLYNGDNRHYNVITNIKAAMAKTYMGDACDTLYDNTHKCHIGCSLCKATTPVLKIRPSIVVNAICGFSVRNDFRTI